MMMSGTVFGDMEVFLERYQAQEKSCFSKQRAFPKPGVFGFGVFLTVFLVLVRFCVVVWVSL